MAHAFESNPATRWRPCRSCPSVSARRDHLQRFSGTPAFLKRSAPTLAEVREVIDIASSSHDWSACRRRLIAPRERSWRRGGAWSTNCAPCGHSSDKSAGDCAPFEIGQEVICAKLFVIGVNSLIGMSLRASPGRRCANADNAILAFCNAGTVSDLGKMNAHHFRRFGVLPSGG
jgi:hypothetical protein